MKAGLQLKNVSGAAASLGEAIGIIALFLSQQIEKPLLLLPLMGLTASFLLRFRLRNGPLFFLVAIAAGASLVSAFAAGGADNTAALSRVLLSVHALLWCAEDPRAYRFWRLSLGFLEVVLASVLAPETYMFGLIFLFAVLSSLALAFGFIERNFARLDPGALEKPVRLSFVAAISGVAVLVFLSSLVIFPVLPRSNWQNQSMRETGYTEAVSFRDATLGWASGNPRPVMWVFRPEGISWPRAVPGGLLRGKILEAFDGLDWRAAVKQPETAVPAALPEEQKLFTLQIFREPLSTEVLPTPYGASGVEAQGLPRRRYESGEFTFPAQERKRVEYQVTVGEGYGLKSTDEPRAVHFRRPDPRRFPRLVALAHELEKGAISNQDKVDRVNQYLKGLNATEANVSSALSSGPHPVETFLFDTKEGHCELFSTAAALLLREMGIATRIAAGFRVLLPQDARVLTVRTAHAHAWAEAYTPRRGWFPLDPTPRLTAGVVWPEFLSAGYDRISAYWHRYILGYETDWPGAKESAKRALPRLAEALGALLLIVFAASGRRAWRRFRQPPRPREELSKLVSKTPSGPLRARYEALRFGAIEPTMAEVRAFREALKRPDWPSA